MNGLIRFAAAAFAFWFAAGRLDAAIRLVQGGGPVAEIVISRQATADEKSAADELARYIQKSTGAALPILTQPTRGRPALLIGMSMAPETVRARVRQLAGDGFLIEATG